jgi:hypothetical protein
MRLPRRGDHLQGDLTGRPAGGARLAGEPIAEGVGGLQHRAGRGDALQIECLDQPGQEPAELGVGGHEPFVERIPRRAHQVGDGAHICLDPGAVGAEALQHLRQGGLVVEGIQQQAHARVHRGDGLVVVAEFSGAAFLATVGRGALQVAEDDVKMSITSSRALPASTWV